MLKLVEEATVQKQALEKMLKEMEKDHTGAEDAIHNWLCDQEDDELAAGILKDDRTIKGALQYCTTKAQKMKSGNVAMVDDSTVFSWVREYFILEKIETKPVTAKVATRKTGNKKTKKKQQNFFEEMRNEIDEAASKEILVPPAPPKIKKSEKVNEEIQMNLFDSL